LNFIEIIKNKKKAYGSGTGTGAKIIDIVICVVIIIIKTIALRINCNILLFEGSAKIIPITIKDIPMKLKYILPIKAKIEEHNFIRIISITSVLTGVVIGLAFELIYPLSSFVIFHFFAFISGIILYIIVREVIPQEEKGRPYYFISGATIFIVILILIELFLTIF